MFLRSKDRRNIVLYMISKVSEYLKDQFSLDLRSLSLMRVLIGAVVILDVAIRMTDITAHYTDQGILPLHALFANVWNKWLFSLHTISSNHTYIVLLFIFQLISAIALTIGYRTKLATIISWILMVSVHNRNPMILQGGDDLLRMILFWGMFIPWGSYYSLDSVKQPVKVKKIFSAATFGYMIQVGAVYFFSAMLKTSPEWRTDSTALYYALSLDQILMPAGKLLYSHYDVMRYMTFIVFRLEFWVPVLLLFPFLASSFRNIAAVLFIFLHIGIGLSLFVGLFFLIGIASSVGLFSGLPADKIHQRLLGETASLPDREHSLGPAVSLSLTVLICYIIVWNLDTTGIIPSIPKQLKAPAYALRVNQNWGMFAPGVFKDDGWYILEADAGKNTIDLNRLGRPVNYEKPYSVVSLFKNDRWRKFAENYLFVNNAWIRPYYASYLLNEWNERYPRKKVQSVRVVYMKEVTGPKYCHHTPCREILSEAAND